MKMKKRQELGFRFAGAGAGTLSGWCWWKRMACSAAAELAPMELSGPISRRQVLQGQGLHGHTRNHDLGPLLSNDHNPVQVSSHSFDFSTSRMDHVDEVYRQTLAQYADVIKKANVMQTEVNRGGRCSGIDPLACPAPPSSHSRLHHGSSTPCNSNPSGSDMGSQPRLEDPFYVKNTSTSSRVAQVDGQTWAGWYGCG